MIAVEKTNIKLSSLSNDLLLESVGYLGGSFASRGISLGTRKARVIWKLDWEFRAVLLTGGSWFISTWYGIGVIRQRSSGVSISIRP